MFDWVVFETTLVETAEAAVNNWLKKNPKQHVYAIAFHECYSELDGAITIPCLGINSLEKQKFEDGSDDEGWKWNPPDWHWTNILPARSPLGPLQKQLTEEACSKTQAHWRKTKHAFDKVLLKVTKHLYQQFAKNPQTTDTFVVYIDDEDGGLELIKRCVPARLFKKHFEHFCKPSFKNLPPQEQIAKYLEEIYTYQNEILAMGDEAIDPLIKKLNDDKDGWVAASMLADLNQPTKRVITALRKHAKSKASTGSHSSIALRLLGDVEFLYSLLSDRELQAQAVDGILAGLKARASGRTPHLALDYSHVERLLAMKSKAIEKKVVEGLKPGSSFLEIKASDVDETLRGLASKHVVIRQHAACVAGDRSLGRAAGQKLLPALAEKLSDPVPNVRRLALFALSYWKAAAAPYHAEMKKLQKDKDPLVREFAYAVFNR